MSKTRLTIIGTLPHPVGGVTIHIRRLLDSLNCEGVDYSFIDYRRDGLHQMFTKTRRNSVVHIHISNPFIRLLLVLIYKYLFQCKVLITIHGNLGRYSNFKDTIVNCSIKYATVPIVINNESYILAQKINNQSKLIPAFIPPIIEEYLSAKIISKVNEIKSQFSFVCSTNASNLNYDKEGKEIYRISFLVNVFSKLTSALIISDPSSSYQNFFIEKAIPLPKNVYLLTEDHSYFELLKIVDCCIRCTSTDGDSLSLKEALFLRKLVLATDVAPRPNGCILFELDNSQDLAEKLDYYRQNIESLIFKTAERGDRSLINTYKHFQQQ